MAGISDLIDYKLDNAEDAKKFLRLAEIEFSSKTGLPARVSRGIKEKILAAKSMLGLVELESSCRNLIIAELKKGTATPVELSERIRKHEVPYIRLVLSRLTENGEVVRVARGVYALKDTKAVEAAPIKDARELIVEYFKNHPIGTLAEIVKWGFAYRRFYCGYDKILATLWAMEKKREIRHMGGEAPWAKTVFFLSGRR